MNTYVKLLRYALFSALFFVFHSSPYLIGAINRVEGEVIKKVKGKIDSVVLYSDRALVRRVVVVDPSAGQKKITFIELPAKLDRGSIRVSGRGISISGILVRKINLNHQDKFAKHPLKIKIEEIKQKIRTSEDLVLNYRSQLKLLDSFGKLTTRQTDRDLARNTINVDSWGKAMHFVEARRMGYQSKIQQTKRRIKNLKKKYKRINQKFTKEIAGKNYYPVEVDVSFSEPSTLSGKKSASVILEYITKGVSWSGVYDLRGDFESGKFHLLTQAKIRQRTGENWESVKLSLSTARPVVGTSPGFLQPWRIRPGSMGQTGNGMNMSNRSRPSKGDMDKDSIDDGYMDSNSKPNFSNASDGAEVTMRIPTRESIKSDYSEHRVKLHSGKLMAKMSYIAIPSISNYVFIKARIKNTGKIPLVPGEMSLFLDGNFVGNAALSSYTAVGEEFDVFLGPDQRLQIKRKLTKGNIIGSGVFNKKVQLLNQWQIEVANYSKKKRQVIVYDQFPVPADPNILIKFIGSSIKNVEKDANGILKWTLNLGAGSKKKFAFSYSISLPVEVWSSFLQIQKSKKLRRSRKFKLYQQMDQNESSDESKQMYNVEQMFMK